MEKLAGDRDLGDALAVPSLHQLVVDVLEVRAAPLPGDGLHGSPADQPGTLLGDVPSSHGRVGLVMAVRETRPRRQMPRGPEPEPAQEWGRAWDWDRAMPARAWARVRDWYQDHRAQDWACQEPVLSLHP